MTATTSDYSERRTITYEWTLRGLKTLFEASKGEQKSKVTKSAKFDGGRWQILFYANSGTGAEPGSGYCSLYLACEPTPEEEEAALDNKWVREGLYSFTFEVTALEKRGERKIQYCTKEALNHSFTYRTANWGWASFARRDLVFFGQNTALNADAFIITCSIHGPPLRRGPPRELLTSVGTLLDDPDYSDVQFVLPRGRSICAMRKLLARRASYYDTMFQSGFSETARAEDDRQVASPDSVIMDELHDDSDFEDDLWDDHLTLPPLLADGPLVTPRPESSPSYDTLGAPSPELPIVPPTAPTAEAQVVSEDLMIQDAAIDGGGDSDAESNVEVEDSPKRVAPPAIEISKPLVMPHGTQRQAQLDKMFRVSVRDSAFSTYRALLYYLYTDTVIFAPLSSSFPSDESVSTTASVLSPQPELPTGEPTSRREWIQAWKRQHPELARDAGGPCSAKSIYRLADKLDLAELKQRAFGHIVASLAVDNIVDEVFGAFSATFADVRKAEMDFFLAHWNEIRASNAMRSIWPAIRSGRHPGFEDVWHLIVMNLDYTPRKEEGGTGEISSVRT